MRRARRAGPNNRLKLKSAPGTIGARSQLKRVLDVPEAHLKFELKRLTTYDDESLLAEVRRVADLVPSGPLKSSAFDRLSKVHSSTLRNRFGNWRLALAAAGLGDRFDDSTEAWTREELVTALKTLAAEHGSPSVTKQSLLLRCRISDRPIRRIFGSYRAALEAAGLRQSPGGVRHTDDDCFENLLAVWVAHGRQPSFGEMKQPPSRVGPKAYVTRWGSWRASLAAFVDRVNTDVRPDPPVPATAICGTRPRGQKRSPRGVSLGLRYTVLKRDCFRCVLCGRSPATHHLSLHVDHIVAWFDGGETRADNLRSLCEDCNPGKGASREDV